MEHLPPVSCPFEPILVPYVGDADYDGLDFSGYPARRGFDLDRLLAGDFQHKASSGVESFLQVWLWFGLLHGILGLKANSADFIRTDDLGLKWLTTEKLPEILHTVAQGVEERRKLPEYNGEYVQQRHGDIARCLSLAYQTWEALARLDTNPLSPEVALGIQILAITLQVGCTQLLLGNTPGKPVYRDAAPWESSLHFRLTRSPFLRDRMIKQGWCPIVVEQLRSGYNVVGQYYASLLGPPQKKLDHSSCSPDDKDCSGLVQIQNLTPKHHTENCQCEILVVDAKRLGEIISKDEIPLLHLRYHNGHPELEVISYSSQPGIEYTALSHVWTDGWGNPNENSLPSCRVEEVVRKIAATYDLPDFDVKFPDPENVKFHRTTKHDDSVYFWMDTLCVPRDPEHIHSKAIVQMRSIYTQAERVLVFDYDLMASTASATYEELNMRIKCSRWIRRLWTLQEAVLAKRLLFQFSDRAHLFMTSSILWQARHEDLKVNYWNTVGWDCDMVFHIYDQVEDDKLLQFLWTLLICDRAVSFESDEPVCGGILMNFDMSKIMDVPISQRMRAFWLEHKHQLPLPVLFVTGPRLKDQGFSWAPSSFLPCQKIGPAVHERGAVTEKGLLFKLPAYRCFTVTAPSRLTEPVFPFSLEGHKYFVRKSPAKANPSWEGLDLHKRNDLAIIIEINSTHESDSHCFSGSRAALVSYIREPTGAISAAYLNLVSVIREGSSFHRFPSVPWSLNEIEHGEREACHAEWISKETEWCLA